MKAFIDCANCPITALHILTTVYAPITFEEIVIVMISNRIVFANFQRLQLCSSKYLFLGESVSPWENIHVITLCAVLIISVAKIFRCVVASKVSVASKLVSQGQAFKVIYV